MIHAGESRVGETDTELCTKLDRFVELTAYDRSYIRLADTDNTIITSVALVLVHFPLLVIEILDHPVTV